MTDTPALRVLFFDVFGTCVVQRTPIADALWEAAKESLGSDRSIDSEVRSRATKMTYEQWFEFGGDWNKDIDAFTSDMKVKHGNVDWRAVDAYRVESLHKLLTRLGLIITTTPTTSTPPSSSSSDPTTSTISTTLPIHSGSLWTQSHLHHLTQTWHHLPPWPDTCRGLTLLNQHFTTATLSNTYTELMQTLVSHSDIPFHHVYTADMFGSYKPNPKVYLSAAERMGFRPEECALVAAHLGDLKGAKACGFYAIYVERPLEEKEPALEGEGIPDLRVEEGEGGFVELARRLGV